MTGAITAKFSIMKKIPLPRIYETLFINAKTFERTRS